MVIESTHPQPDELTLELRALGVLVQQAVYGAMAALATRNAPAARIVLEREADVTDHIQRIDALASLALHPVPPDEAAVRRIVGVLKVTSDLEHMAEQAALVARAVIRLAALPPLQAPPALAAMGGTARELVAEALAAFMGQDPDRSRHVLQRGIELARLHAEVMESLQQLMARDGSTVARGTELLVISTALATIGKYAAGLCQWLLQFEAGRPSDQP